MIELFTVRESFIYDLFPQTILKRVGEKRKEKLVTLILNAKRLFGTEFALYYYEDYESEGSFIKSTYTIEINMAHHKTFTQFEETIYHELVHQLQVCCYDNEFYFDTFLNLDSFSDSYLKSLGIMYNKCDLIHEAEAYLTSFRWFRTHVFYEYYYQCIDIRKPLATPIKAQSSNSLTDLLIEMVQQTLESSTNLLTQSAKFELL